MFKIDTHPKIVINLDAGLYKFASISGSGKSDLVRLINRMASVNSQIVAYTYRDYLCGLPLEKVLIPKYKVAILDEYSLYAGFGRDAIAEFAKHGILLIDCKNDLNALGIPYKIASVYMPDNCIEVL